MVSGRLYPTSDKVSVIMIACGVWVGSGARVDVGAKVGEGVCVGASVAVGILVTVCNVVAVSAWAAVSTGTKWVVGIPVGATGMQAEVSTRTRKKVVKRSRVLLVVSVILFPRFFSPAIQSSLSTRDQVQRFIVLIKLGLPWLQSITKEAIISKVRELQHTAR
jgi:hypothetical protein